MCSVEGCKAPVAAKGLCSMHYMRMHRQGDPGLVGKAGRPPLPANEASRKILPHKSPRTQARYVQADKLLRAAGCGEVEIIDLRGNVNRG